MALRPSESSGAFINRIENVNHVELELIYQVDVIFLARFDLLERSAFYDFDLSLFYLGLFFSSMELIRKKM